MGSKTYQGIGVSEGIRIAKAFVYRQPVVQEGTSISAEQTDTETARFEADRKSVCRERV